MSRPPERFSLTRALGISTALHLLLATLLTTSAALTLGRVDRAPGSGATETMRVSFMTIEHRALARHVAPAHPRTAARAVAHSAPRPAPARAAAAPLEQPATTRAPAALPRVALTLATAAPERTPNAPPPEATSAAEGGSPRQAATEAPAPPAPTVAPSPPGADSAEVAARSVDVPPGGWGQSFDKPLVADEAALAEIRSRYPAGTARIDVDEAGHATHVSLPAGLSDDVRAELERRLLELRYVPAECNGLRCGGTLQITI